MRTKVVALSGCVALLLTAGCGGDTGPGPAPRPSTPDVTTPATTAGGEAGGDVMGTSAVKGAVQFQGTAPQAQKIRMDADPFCTKQHPQGAVTENVVVNDNGTLRHVFVYVKDGLGGRTYPVPDAPAQIDQHGCRYEPHVLGMMAGQSLKILNSDDTLHNIHAQPTVNKAFNIAMPKYVKEREETFTEPEVMIPVKCDVHSWMATYVGVVTHPFFAVTGGDGSFDLSRLPAGTYTIEAWHEKYGSQSQQVTVAEGEEKEITFTFKAS